MIVGDTLVFGEHAAVGQTQKTSNPPPSKLRTHDPNGDTDDVAAQRRGIAKVVDLTKEPEKHLLPEIFDVAMRAERSQEHAPHHRREAIPNGRRGEWVTLRCRASERGVVRR